MNISIPSTYIIDYLTQNLNLNYRISSGGKEFVCESIFVDNDYKRHLSVNLFNGLFRCFKTGETGNFFRLVSEVEGITYAEAVKRVLFRSFDYEKDTPVKPTSSGSQKSLDESLLTRVGIADYESPRTDVLKAWNYAYGRSLFNTNDDSQHFYVSTQRGFEDRIIIPFELNSRIFFYQARALDADMQPKYLAPGFDNELLKSSNLLYPFDESQDQVVVVEGVLCARSLQIQGINATSIQGSFLSRLQAEHLKEWGGHVILGFDNDEAGTRCFEKFEQLRKKLIMPEFSVAAVPGDSKDWNEAHMKSEDLTQAINNAKLYDYRFRIFEGLKSL